MDKEKQAKIIKLLMLLEDAIKRQKKDIAIFTTSSLMKKLITQKLGDDIKVVVITPENIPSQDMEDIDEGLCLALTKFSVNLETGISDWLKYIANGAIIKAPPIKLGGENNGRRLSFTF
jgi:hypothetical protein